MIFLSAGLGDGIPVYLPDIGTIKLELRANGKIGLCIIPQSDLLESIEDSEVLHSRIINKENIGKTDEELAKLRLKPTSVKTN